MGFNLAFKRLNTKFNLGTSIHLKMREILSFEESEIGYSVTQDHNPEKQVYPPSLTAYEDLDSVSQ